MCGTSNQYSIADPYTRQLVSAFREAGPKQNNPLRTERWSGIIQYGDDGDSALEGAGYDQSIVTHVVGKKGYLFARATESSRDFYIRIESTELSPTTFSGLKLGQILMVLPSDEPPAAGRAWPAKHAMLA